MTDSELVERARAGDADAFGELVARHEVAVYRAASAALRSAEEAEDVAQEAFVAAFQKLGEFRGEATFKTWLMAITWNTARTRRRTSWRWLQRFTSSGDREALDPPARERSHEDALIQDDLRAQVRQMVLTLPAKFRDVLLLAASGDHTMDEIAGVLGIPVGTVKWRISEGRRHLRAKLARIGIGHG